MRITLSDLTLQRRYAVWMPRFRHVFRQTFLRQTCFRFLLPSPGSSPASPFSERRFSSAPLIFWLLHLLLERRRLELVGEAALERVAGAAVGLDFTMQLVVCAAVLAGGCLSVIAVRRRNAGRKDPSAKLQHLDSGQWVTVDVVGSDGLAVVQYRGAPWVARPEGNEPLTPGRWTIARVDGTQLVLGRRF